MVLITLRNIINRRNIGQHVPQLESWQSGCWRAASAKLLSVLCPRSQGCRHAMQMVWKGGRQR